MRFNYTAVCADDIITNCRWEKSLVDKIVLLMNTPVIGFACSRSRDGNIRGASA